MSPETISLIAAASAALLVGFAAGWVVRARRGIVLPPVNPPDHADAPPSDAIPDRSANGTVELRERDIQEAETLMTRLDTYLATLQSDIGDVRAQVELREQEHTQLLATLNERRAQIESTQVHLKEAVATPADRVVEDIDRTMDELDTLHQLKDDYLGEIAQLTQDLERQDSELRMLRQTHTLRTEQMIEAQALADQADRDLRRLIHDRQSHDIDIEYARRAIKELETELRDLIKQQQNLRNHIHVARQNAASEQDVIYVPPRPPNRLPSGREHRALPSGQIDDLSLIPGLLEIYAVQLRILGIRSFMELSACDPADLARRLDIPGHHRPDIGGWIAAARRLAYEDNTHSP